MFSCLFSFDKYFGGYSAGCDGLLGGLFFKGENQPCGIGHGLVCFGPRARDVRERERVGLVR